MKMAKERTKKSKYHSRYAESYVSAAQYITEIICERKSAMSKQDLPVRFWQLKEWQKYFRFQIKTANALLKKYHEKAVVKALLDPRGERIGSLNNPNLIPLIEEFQKQVEIEMAAVPAELPKININEKPRQLPKTKLEKLMDIDNE